MSQSKPDVCPELTSIPNGDPRVPQSFALTLLDLPSLPVSLIRQAGGLMRERRESAGRRNEPESRLPISDQRPWYRDLPEQIQSYLAIRKLAPAGYDSRVADVRDLWRDYKQNPYSWANSLLIHLFVLTAMLLPFALRQINNPIPVPKKIFDVTPLVFPFSPFHGNAVKTSGGGGSGDQTPLPPTRGVLPPYAPMQFTPALAQIPKIPPALPMPATLVGPPELKPPTMNPDQAFGDPHGVVGPLSGGPGTGGSFGNGNGPGDGPGNGPGHGPGQGGGCCEGIFNPGIGGVSAPIPIYSPEPSYSEEARKAKYSGIVTLWIVVDAQGVVRSARVVKPLGMGLDEEAVKTVSTWKFKPAMRHDAPVPVQVQVEVSFRLF